MFLTRLLTIACIFLGILRLTAAEVPRLIASQEALKAVVPEDVRLETLGGGYSLLIPEAFTPPVIATDPIYKQTTSRAIYLYEKEPIKHGMARRVVVHFEPDDRESAIRSARLVARFLRLHRERFKRETVFRRSAKDVHVWFVPSLSDRSIQGGETRDNNVYIFAASAIKTPIELARTVAHEWGHETLPAARGFASPENDASGYLGERLYLYFLFFDTLWSSPKNPDDGTTAETLRFYYDRQVKPLMARYEEGGPHSKLLDADSTEAMDYYIGAVIDMAETIGPHLVGEALYSIDDTSPRDFLDALKTEVARKIPEGVFVSMRAWLPFGNGQYVMTPVSGGGGISLTGPQSLSATADGPKSGLLKPRSGEKRDGTFRVTKPGWYRMTPNGSLSEFTIKLIGGAK
ncbi:MAG: hypothetical protein H8F28_25505 [Fibrella sp.]|nr:hypothetical protein [Armatimonadota bacterium]